MSTFYTLDSNSLYLHPFDAMLQPFSSTSVAPPSVTAGQVAQWTSTVPLYDPTFGSSTTGSWATVADNRSSTLYNTSDGSVYVIGSTIGGNTYSGIGAIPSWLTASPMPAYATWTNGTWVVDTAAQLAAAQAAQVATLSLACQNSILSGFTSSALGSAYTYPSKATDQQNLASSVLASLMPNIATDWVTPFWCEDSTSTWAFVNHTAAQIQQVGEDAKTAILANMAQNATLATQVAAATTVAAVQAIVWVAPTVS
jgi:hypothetical protein